MPIVAQRIEIRGPLITYRDHDFLTACGIIKAHDPPTAMRTSPRRPKANVVRAAVLVGFGCLLVAEHSVRADEPQATDNIRTLVLALDGIPFRVVQQACAQGAFAEWPEPQPLVSTFPSVTNVAFTAMLQPLGLNDRFLGYEIRHYDIESNQVLTAKPFNKKKRQTTWRGCFHVAPASLGAKIGTYIRPKRRSWKTIAQIERFALESPEDLMLTMVGSTDALIHFHGDQAGVRFLVKLADRLEELKRRHLETRGRSLRLVLLSDHGNTSNKVRNRRGFRRQLRRSGFRTVGHLDKSNDVVAATFGVVGYGALFLDDDQAERAARAIVAHPAVELAAWRSGRRELRVISESGDATVRWSDGQAERSFAYHPESDDPLRLRASISHMIEVGMLDQEGYASQGDWLASTALAEFPDAPRRLVNALTGAYVKNAGTLVFSLHSGDAWGLRTAQIGAWLLGGRLEGTHGGLDRASTLGFFLSDEAATQPKSAVPAENALSRLTGFRKCLESPER